MTTFQSLGKLAITGLLVLFLPTVAWATKPIVSRLDPPGMQRGVDTEILIRGARIGDVKKLLFYQPGIEVLSLTMVDDNSVKAMLKVPADYPTGLHAFRLVTETGISNLRMFGVGPFPQVNEVEPNSEFSTPQAIAMSSTVVGVIDNEDVDYFVVDLAEGQALTVELEGLRLGTEFFDPFVAILDSNRFELARSDDIPLLQQDCVCAAVAPKAGKYIIEVRESAYGGNGNCQYRLHVGSFPRPMAVLPSGGRPGEQVNLHWIDATGAQWDETVALPAESHPRFPVYAKRGDFVAPSPNWLRVLPYTNVTEVEPNEDPSKLAPTGVPVAFHGILDKPNDIDWYTFSATKDQQLDINVYARRVLRSPVDAWIEVYNSAGGLLAANDDSGGPDSYLSFRVPEDGQYRIAIRDHLNDGSPFHSYRIEVAPVAASLTFSVAEQEQYVSTTVAVPKGRRMAVMLNAGRSYFSGDLKVELQGLSEKVTLDPLTIPAAYGTVPMMIRAAADAPVDSALADVVGTPVTGEPAIVGHLDQRTMMVRGQNNIDVWGHNASKLAVAATAEPPFDIQVVQPQVPITRFGQSNLVVKATRKEGYKEPIALGLLYAPGGIAASGSVVIAGDQTEALIPITCNEGGAIGTWPITVLAYATVGNERVVIASEFINLEIVDSFFNFQFTKQVAEQGQSLNVVVGLEAKRPPEGELEIELLGLPAGVTSTAPKATVAADAKSVSFPVSVAADARPGKFSTLVCQMVIKRPGGQIVQTQGTGEFQIDVPLPAPVAQPAAAAPPPPPATPAAAPEKVLTRLEILRQQREAARGGAPKK